jgi:hypothetical protein
MIRISTHKCDRCHYNEQDGICSCVFKCSKCETEFQSGKHSAEQCLAIVFNKVNELQKQINIMKGNSNSN